MARSFADLWASLNLNTSNFNAKLRDSEKRVNRFAKHMLGLTKETDDLFDPKKKGAFKDPSRIIQGIVVAKAFYSTMNAIRKCKDAVWEFSQELEYAHMAYSNLFGDTALAEEFINVLEDFAARTPFSFKQSEAAAKRLLAYGIEYKNVMYVMQGVLAASAAQKDPHVIEAVSRALGQIYTKGRLMNEEMRQLAEAGIPAYEILREKLGLTQEQLQNLGRQAIPASQAINALIEGMNERFGSVVKESVNTVPGLISNIKDNLLMTTSGLFDPLYNQIRELLKRVNKAAQSIREVFTHGGSGAVLEKLFPKWALQDIRMFVAAFGNLAIAVHRLVKALLSLLKPALLAVIRVFNALAPLLTVVSNILSALVKVIMSNEVVLRGLSSALAIAATMWVLFKAKAVACAVIGYIVKAIDYAVKGLIFTLTFLHAHPIWGMLMLGAGLLIGISGGFGKISEAVTFLHRKLMALSGFDPDKILLPSQKDRADDLDKFNQALDGTKDSMDELGNSTGKTAKAAKNLLSFDEVFRLKEPDEGANGGIQTPDLGDLGDFGDFPDIGMDDMMPEDSAFDSFSGDFFSKLIESMKTKVLSAGLGAALGGIIGGVFTKSALGAKVGMALGAAAGLLWDTLADKLNMSSVGRFVGPAATGLGLAIGKLVGHPLIGLAIGGFVGWVSDAIGRGLETNDWTGTIAPACTAIGAAIGHFVPVVGPIIGAAIGAVVGFIVDAIVDNWDAISAWFSNAVTVVGDWFSRTAAKISTWWSGAVSVVSTKLSAAKTAIATWWTNLWDNIGTWFANAKTTIVTWWTDLCSTVSGWFTSAIEGISTWFTGIINSISTWFANVANTVVTWLTNMATSVQVWWQTAWLNVTTALTNLWTMLTTFVTSLWTSLTTWLTTAWATLSAWASSLWSTFTEWLVNLWTSFTEWIAEMRTSLATWLTDMWEAVTSWAASVWESFVGWLNRVWTSVTTWFTNIWSAASTWLATTWTNIANWFANMWSTFSTWLANLRTTLSTWLSNIWSSVAGWFSRIIGSVRAWFGNILSATVQGLSSIWSNVMGWFGNLFSAIWRKLTDFAGRVREWWSNLWAGKTSFFGFGGSNGPRGGHPWSSGGPRSAPRPAAPFDGSGGFAGHASGGVFNREHLARFAEGNKAEAIIPLENGSAMKPFVDAVANGLTATLAPMLAVSAGPQQPQLPPVYVGTLIADDRGLRELERRMQIIRIQETKRRG